MITMERAKATDPEVVERPVLHPRSTIPARVFQALMATVETGKAIRVPMNGKTRSQVFFKYWSALQRRGMRARSRVDGTYLILWAERKTPQKRRQAKEGKPDGSR